MKSHLIFSVFILLFAGSAFSRESEFIAFSECYVQSVQDDERIPKNVAKVRVVVSNNDFQRGEVIQYGYESLNFEASLDDELGFDFSMDSGIVEFQFYPKNRVGLTEITSFPLHIKGGAITTLVIHFLNQAGIIEMVKKPVIYLYPTQIELVSVQVKTPGELTFTYPRYEDGWTFTATPSGELQFGDETYNYLFWEAELEISQSDWMRVGKLVDRDELLEYIESVVEKMGFTSKEKADFITFWAPQMLRYDQTFVRFMLNEECDQFAELSISPTPDQLVRVYIIWSPIESVNVSRHYDIQQFPEMHAREGFTVIEWGGVQR